SWPHVMEMEAFAAAFHSYAVAPTAAHDAEVRATCAMLEQVFAAGGVAARAPDGMALGLRARRVGGGAACATRTRPAGPRLANPAILGARLPAGVSLELPKLAARNARTFGQRAQLGPDDVGIDRRLAHPGAVSAIAAGDHVFAANELGVASNPLRHQIRMLDEIGFRFDHAGDQHLAVRQANPLEQRPLVTMPRVRRLERDRARPRAEHQVDDVGERH